MRDSDIAELPEDEAQPWAERADEWIESHLTWKPRTRRRGRGSEAGTWRCELPGGGIFWNQDQARVVEAVRSYFQQHKDK